MVILSDLSEVLVHGLYGTEEVIKEKYGKIAADQFWDRHLGTEDEFMEVLRGNLSEDAYWYGFLSQGYWPFNVYELKRCFTENMCRTIPGTLELYQRIAKYPVTFGPNREFNEGRPEIYIVSDHIAERIGFLKEIHPDVFLHTSKQFWSCYMGKIKKDPGFFKNLLKECKKAPEDVLLIDDSEANIKSAAECGIKGIQFENATDLKTKMKELGFEFK